MLLLKINFIFRLGYLYLKMLLKIIITLINYILMLRQYIIKKEKKVTKLSIISNKKGLKYHLILIIQ